MSEGTITEAVVRPPAHNEGQFGESNRQWLAMYAQQMYENGKRVATLESPTFTGVPKAPTPSTDDNSTKIATTGFVVAKISNSSFTLNDGDVTEPKIANGAVGTTKLPDGAITNSKLADGSVTSAKIGDLAIGSGKLSDSAIIEAKVADAAITSAKLASDSVSNAKLADGAVTSGKLADNSILAAKIPNGTITGSKLENSGVTAGSYTKADITVDAFGRITSADNGGDGGIGSGDIDDGSITSAKLASGSVIEAKLGTGSVTTNKIGANAITAAKVADNSITSSQLSVTGVVAGDYTFTNITVDAAGRITGIQSNSSAGGYTDEEAVDAVSTALTDSETIGFTYDDNGNELAAILTKAASGNLTAGSQGELGSGENGAFVVLGTTDKTAGAGNLAPIAGQKAALAGRGGTPGDTNRYLLEGFGGLAAGTVATDSRIAILLDGETEAKHALISEVLALGGGSGGGGSDFVLEYEFFPNSADLDESVDDEFLFIADQSITVNSASASVHLPGDDNVIIALYKNDTGTNFPSVITVDTLTSSNDYQYGIDTQNQTLAVGDHVRFGVVSNGESEASGGGTVARGPLIIRLNCSYT